MQVARQRGAAGLIQGLCKEYGLMRVLTTVSLMAAVGLALAGCDGRRPVKRAPQPVEATAVISVPGMT
jgi:hypothetical protein